MALVIEDREQFLVGPSLGREPCQSVFGANIHDGTVVALGCDFWFRIVRDCCEGPQVRILARGIGNPPIFSSRQKWS